MAVWCDTILTISLVFGYDCIVADRIILECVGKRLIRLWYKPPINAYHFSLIDLIIGKTLWYECRQMLDIKGAEGR